jgi:hypothetical protein
MKANCARRAPVAGTEWWPRPRRRLGPAPATLSSLSPSRPFSFYPQPPRLPAVTQNRPHLVWLRDKDQQWLSEESHLQTAPPHPRGKHPKMGVRKSRFSSPSSSLTWPICAHALKHVSAKPRKGCGNSLGFL